MGKRVGVRAWSQTTGVWVRGILQDEYGIAPDSMTWVTEEDAHVQEFADPPFVQRIAAGQDLRAMLLSGEIDAAIALAGLDPEQVRTVIPDADAAAAAWSRKTGVYPINHVVVVKDALLAEHPWLAGRADASVRGVEAARRRRRAVRHRRQPPCHRAADALCCRAGADPPSPTKSKNCS